MLQFGRGEMSEYISCGYRSHIYRISNNLFLWKITKRTYCIWVCVFNYEFSLLGNNFYKFVVQFRQQTLASSANGHLNGSSYLNFLM
jgi:hypothetical protein